MAPPAGARWRRAPLLADRRAAAAIAFALIALAGCGSSASRSPSARASVAVATVAGAAISEQALEHWMVIKRIELVGSAPASAPSEAQVRDKALAFLITAEWLQNEAAARGVSVPASQTEAFYEHLLKSPSGGEFAAGLKRRGLSREDELLVLRIGELAQGLRTQIAGGAHLYTPAARQRVRAFLTAYRERWKQRTTCRSGYVIAECANGPPLVPVPGSAR